MQSPPPGVAQAEKGKKGVEGGLLFLDSTARRVTKETLPLRTARLLGIAAETSGKVSRALRAVQNRLLIRRLLQDRSSGKIAYRSFQILLNALLHQRKEVLELTKQHFVH